MRAAPASARRSPSRQRAGSGSSRRRSSSGRLRAGRNRVDATGYVRAAPRRARAGPGPDVPRDADGGVPSPSPLRVCAPEREHVKFGGLTPLGVRPRQLGFADYGDHPLVGAAILEGDEEDPLVLTEVEVDRKSTRLNSSHVAISYAVFCLKKKTI